MTFAEKTVDLAIARGKFNETEVKKIVEDDLGYTYGLVPDEPEESEKPPSKAGDPPSEK